MKADRKDPVLAAAWGAASFPLFAVLFFALPSLPDLDSYYHLAVARLYATQGFVRGLPWARLSILGETLGDKELLFHVFLVPFSSMANGGRIALALLLAVFVVLFGWIASRLAGPRAAGAGLWLLLTGAALSFRLVRLRPEIGALLLLLLFVHFVASRRAIAAGAVCALFALSYTAWHLPLGLAVILAAATRDRDLRLTAYPLLGTAAGVLVHPHFPDNVRIFWVQNVVFFLRKGALDVGEEIHAPRLPDILLYNLGLWAGLALLLWFARRHAPVGATPREDVPAEAAAVAGLDSGGPQARGSRPAGGQPPSRHASSPADRGLRAAGRNRRDQHGDDTRRDVIVYATTAGVFLLMFFFMERMATYALPFATLAVLARVRDVPRRAVPLLLCCVLLSAPWSRELLVRTRANGVDENDLRSFGAAVPKGAKIAATWGAAEAFCWSAPQGRYLNVLDPVFMDQRSPRALAAVRAIFSGAEPDVPLTAAGVLDSEFVAFRARETPRVLFDRLKNDPRSRLLHSGETFLVGFVPSDAFVTRWTVSDPRNPHRKGSYTGQGYVDLTPAGGTCVTSVARIGAGRYELAPYGPATYAFEGTAPVRVAAAAAVLGGGHRFTTTGAAITVVSCRDARSARNGFYLVRR